jgi:hypothetical protein
MLTGAEGGVYYIIKSIAESILIDTCKVTIANIVADFWVKYSYQEQQNMVSEYLEQYKDILPQHIKKIVPYIIKYDFQKVLREHPWMIRRLRNR